MSVRSILGFCLVLILAGVGMFFLASELRGDKASSLSELNDCFSNTSTASQNAGPNDECLQERIASLLNSFSTADLMNYAVASTTPYSVTSYCHNTAHIIGEETFIKWDNVEAALDQCTRACSLGCTHGVIAGAVAKELGATYLSEDIIHADPIKIQALGATYCFPDSPLCHAVGHILYIGSQNIQTSLNGCEKISEGRTTESCYEGVFMEAAGGTEVFVKSTTTPERTDNDYAYPCNSVATKYQHACFQYLTNFQRQLFTKNNVPVAAQFDIIRNVCESFSGKKSRSDCFVGIGYIFLRTRDNRDSISPRSPTLCETLPGIDQDSCVVGLTLKTILSGYASGFNYCNGRSDENRLRLCYNVVFQTMKANSFTDEKVRTLCETSNDADRCKKQFEMYLPVAKSLPQYFSDGLF